MNIESTTLTAIPKMSQLKITKYVVLNPGVEISKNEDYPIESHPLLIAKCTHRQPHMMNPKMTIVEVRMMLKDNKDEDSDKVLDIEIEPVVDKDSNEVISFKPKK